MAQVFGLSWSTSSISSSEDGSVEDGSSVTIPNLAGRWQINETGQAVVLHHHLWQNMIWSAPEAGREDVIGYCKLGVYRKYVTIVATWGGVEQRLGVVKVSRWETRILWMQTGTDFAPESKSVWRLLGPEPCTWKCSTIIQYSAMRLQVLHLRLPKCACALDLLAMLMCLFVIWISVLGALLAAQEGIVTLMCNSLLEQIDECQVLIHWHTQHILSLIFFLSLELLFPLTKPKPYIILVYQASFFWVILSRVVWIPRRLQVPPYFRVAYGTALGMTIILSILRLGFWYVCSYRIRKSDPSTWPGVRALDEEERAGVINEFLQDCRHALTVEEVFAVDKGENSTPPVAQSSDHSTHARQLYHVTSARAIKDVITVGFMEPLRLRCGDWAPALMSWLTISILGGPKLMFGKGIYFATNPDKGWNHACDLSGESAADCRYILACDVALGRSRVLKNAAEHLTPELMHRRSVEGYDYQSVTGLEQELGGVLENKECVIFNPSQATPKFIFRVRRKPTDIARHDTDTDTDSPQIQTINHV